MNKKMALFIVCLGLYVLFFVPLLEWDIKVKGLIALLIVQILWIGRVFPLAFSSILLILVLSFHFFSYEETLRYISSDIVWLLFSTFILSKAFIKTGLANRVSLKMLSFSKGSGSFLLLLSFFLMFILAVLIPSNIGKGSLLSSILDRVIKSLEKISDVRNLAKSLFIGVAYLAAISGGFVATGASSTIYTFGIFQDSTHHFSFLTWIMYFAPPILLFIILLWVLLLIHFPYQHLDKELLKSLIDGKVEELGAVNKNEVKISCIMAVTLLLWITQNLHGFSIPLVGLLGASLTVMPGIGVWNWEEARKSVDWDMMIFFASTLMVSGMLIKTDTVGWVANWIVLHNNFASPVIILIVLIVCTALLRIIFVNILGFLTIMLPLALTIGENLIGMEPIIVAMAVFLTGIPGFLLITQSPVHLISFSFGYFDEKDLFRIGKWALFIWLIIVILSATLYWRWIV
ncbi:SLC13 family permease [Radiobacillus deserti]|uniref:Sodium-dependent dicarboxylate transporter SdcS n=1 Tax=Radiobacillus deserti TaxID=2594883 RepID=A0A516KEV7_9BACI|nr:SLC13 family permease [Radiobacillus deserti]QDP39952.1 citrate:succinate antiporter [Radiobacillus deserti]